MRPARTHMMMKESAMIRLRSPSFSQSSPHARMARTAAAYAFPNKAAFFPNYWRKSVKAWENVCRRHHCAVTLQPQSRSERLHGQAETANIINPLKRNGKMNIYFNFSIWKFRFSVSVNGSINSKKD